MQNKYLEKVVSITSYDDEVLQFPFNLEYYLIVSVTKDNQEQEGILEYGIEIVKKIGNEKIESGLIGNITSKRQTAVKLIQKFARNSVTPLSLSYVVDDFIGI